MKVKISGYETTIKDSDFEKFSKIKWRIDRNKEKQGYFYFQGEQVIDGKKYTVLLHRYLMDCVKGDGKIVDHIDGNTLNNDTDNLRICTQAENCRNQKRASNNTSGFKGVSFEKKVGKYVAGIKVNRKQIFLGYFHTPELAHEAYCEASRKYHGEFRRIE